MSTRHGFRKESMSIIDKLFTKRGIEKIEELAPEEQAQIQKWQVILSGESVTVASLKEFCQSQLRIIESKADGIHPLTTIQQACIHVYINLLKAIEAPEAERESLEKYLTTLINT
mgnify:CR=1 FL=1